MDIEKMIKAQNEARQVRRSTANWEFIRSLPPKLRIALEYYIETGNFREAARMADMSVDEFLYFSKDKANIYDMS
ncbi:hypothetical protein J5U23_01753 [Saccharolobus shibatae B12]|uniref:PaREP6 n=1 Tax=Saccharolobus shibatae (strain ATCC 51178 / DSM 5389 / JCM 8931 / NBRC 15437 / B12) TaxID=523848 RepID=A0A8F5BPB4_SACSH|nr:hypothetical protein [Saccharolobus shibatae]QXJ28884.1 hypothetical protein J5U23_01753 [Saccharolobus shibatae B12]